jgi:hypothetical protein
VVNFYIISLAYHPALRAPLLPEGGDLRGLGFGYDEDNNFFLKPTTPNSFKTPTTPSLRDTPPSRRRGFLSYTSLSVVSPPSQGGDFLRGFLLLREGGVPEPKGEGEVVGTFFSLTF